MANSPSARKRIRVTARRTLRNRMVKSRMRTAIKRYEAALSEGDVQTSTELLNKATSQIDRAAAKGVIHKNEASRRKARLAKRLNASQAAQ